MSTQAQTPVKISLETLKRQVNEGMKKKELASHYGIPVMQMTQILKDNNIQIRKFHYPKYELVETDADLTGDTAVDAEADTVVDPSVGNEVVDTAPAVQEEQVEMPLSPNTSVWSD